MSRCTILTREPALLSKFFGRTGCWRNPSRAQWLVLVDLPRGFATAMPAEWTGPDKLSRIPRRHEWLRATVRKMSILRTVRTMDMRVSIANAPLRLVTPTTEKRTVMPKRGKNADLRTREYLTEQEIEALMAAARQNRYGHRDATMILMAFRHGLRASEAVDLRWDQVDFNRAVLHVRRSKGGSASVHPLSG